MLAGIGVRHYASGRRVYIVQTRMAGRLRTVTIGSAAVLSEAQAVAVGRRVLAHAIVGDNPAEVRQRVRATPTYARFLDEFWAKIAVRWKPSTQITMMYNRRRYFDDAFAGLAVDAITEADVARWFARVSERSGPGGANRCMSILSAMLGKAEAWGYRVEGSNPCPAIRRNRKRSGERFLSDNELARLGSVLQAGRSGPDKRQAMIASAITLLLLTGCRRSEILGLQWGDVRGLRLLLRDSKTGPRTVWLGKDARGLIDELPRLKKVRWLFSVDGDQLLGRDVYRGWETLREAAGLPGVRLHDLRHTFASHAAARSETLPMIGKLLGHATVQSTARYAHLDDLHLLSAANRIGDCIQLISAY